MADNYVICLRIPHFVSRRIYYENIKSVSLHLMLGVIRSENEKV
jgi:hypothetical protein